MDAEESEPPLSPLKLSHYKVERSKESLLGKGGYGRVCKGRHIETQEAVAVKEVEKNEKTCNFIEREMSYMQTCKHYNIVRFFDTKETKDSTYIIMEYCQNGNMDQYMHKHKISFEKCMSFMMNIADAVEYLHCEKTICHRDIKPDNILVANNGQDVKLGDFGLARLFPGSCSRATGTGVGTYGWLAPEILHEADDRSRYSFSADIFALGLVFLALLLALPGKSHLLPYTGMYKIFSYTLTLQNHRHQVRKNSISHYFAES